MLDVDRRRAQVGQARGGAADHDDLAGEFSRGTLGLLAAEVLVKLDVRIAVTGFGSPAPVHGNPVARGHGVAEIARDARRQRWNAEGAGQVLEVIGAPDAVV